MAISTAELDFLERSLQRDREELAKKEEAIRVVRAMLGAEKSRINIDDILSAPPRKTTLIDFAASALKLLEDREFTVRNLHAAMEKSGAVFKARNPLPRIQSIISKFVEEGKVRRTFKGEGAEPHRYKVATGSSSKHETEGR